MADRLILTRRSANLSWGVVALATVTLGTVVLWLAARPGGEPGARFLGELFGVEAVALFSCSLVLATLLPIVENAFGGLDRVAMWHRRVAIGGLVCLLAHVALVSSPADSFATPLGRSLGDLALAGLAILGVWALAPGLRAARWPGPIRHMARATYEHWLTAHRLTGLFVAAAVAHGAIVDPVLHRSILLRVAFLIIGGTGVAAYLYRELLARYFVPIYDYTVAELRQLNDSTLEVGLDPVRQPLSFAAGQFVFLAFGGLGGWQRHPFTVSSRPGDARLTVTIKALGDYTEQLSDKLRRGIPAKVAGPFGGFDFRKGGDTQIWIAGGIGITPFISWIRSFEGSLHREVDFYYSVGHRDQAVYLDEIQAASARDPSFRAHLVCTDEGGRLTAERVLGTSPPGASPWVFMCGPPPMMKGLANELDRAGLPDNQVRWEQFGVR